MAPGLKENPWGSPSSRGMDVLIADGIQIVLAGWCSSPEAAHSVARMGQTERGEKKEDLIFTYTDL